jgi:GT2 family glycosyltransferase
VSPGQGFFTRGAELVVLSIVMPTFRRERVLGETICSLLALRPPPEELLVIDQTKTHERETDELLSRLDRERQIRWIRMEAPSIPRAMNVGLREARGKVVLFVDDDIVPQSNLLSAHVAAHENGEFAAVAGQVLQPGQNPLPAGVDSKLSCFNSSVRREVPDFVGCNFSVRRSVALSLGGFDENFVRAGYRYEAEFSSRLRRAGKRIVFEPAASVRHLKAGSGGIRSFGNYLTTLSPGQCVGAYYHVFRSEPPRRWLGGIGRRLLDSIRTRHHVRRPWWVPATLIAEFQGILWAAGLSIRGPRLMGQDPKSKRTG